MYEEDIAFYCLKILYLINHSAVLKLLEIKYGIFISIYRTCISIYIVLY